MSRASGRRGRCPTNNISPRRSTKRCVAGAACFACRSRRVLRRQDSRLPTSPLPTARLLAAPCHASQLQESFGTLVERLFFLLIVQGLIVGLFATVFTEAGFGASIFKYMATHHEYYFWTRNATLLSMFLLYMFDFRFWAPGFATYFVGACVAAGLFLMAVFAFQARPYYPLVIMYIGTPLVYMFFYVRVFKKCHISNFMTSLAAVLIVWGLLCMCLAFLFNFHFDFWWGNASKFIFRTRLRVCDTAAALDPANPDVVFANFTNQETGLVSAEDFDQYFHFNDENEDIGKDRMASCEDTNVTGIYGGIYGESGEMWCCSPHLEVYEDSACHPEDTHCLAAFMLWGAPMMGGTVMFMFGIICVILAGAVNETHVEGNVTHSTKVFLYMMGVGVLGVYVAASIAGASMQIAQVVKTFAVLTIGICVVLIGTSIGWRSLEEELHEIPIVAKIEGATRSNLLKAVGVLIVTPVYVSYCIISAVNQLFRRALPCTKDVHGDEAHLVMTQLGTNLFNNLKQWNWTAVLSKVVWAGFIYFVFSVGVGRLTTLGLSVLNHELKTSELPAVTAIYFIVGFVMFLLPPVPGVPVYLTGGIVLAKTAMDEDRGFNSFGLGVAYASFWACFVKAMAILGQQKVIGGVLGSKVGVRQAVGVNSVSIRAIRLILQEKGLSPNKMTILVGGPDWPTSVLTGILKQSYIQMLLGSTPFLITIPITVLAGALQLRAKESPALAAAAGTILMLASLTQAGCGLMAAVAIDDVSRARKDELDTEELDQEVLEADAVQLRATAKFERVTEWSKLGCFPKFLLIVDAGQSCPNLRSFLPLHPALICRRAWQVHLMRVESTAQHVHTWY
jgi:hypothetical protein